MNIVRPTMAGMKLVPKPSGRTTSAAPATPKKVRKSIQERGLRRTCRILGISSTKANRVPTASWRSLLPKASGWERAGLVVSLIFDISNAISQAASRRFRACVQTHAAGENGDRAANNQRHVKRVNHFLALPAFFAAAN